MGHVDCGSIFSSFPLPQQPRDCRFLRFGASLKPLLDLEIGSSFAASCGALLPVPPAAREQRSAGAATGSADRSLPARSRKSGRPLEARLQVLPGVGIDKQRDRQQVGLLLILIADYLSGFRLLGVQSSLSGHNGGDCGSQVRPACCSLAAMWASLVWATLSSWRVVVSRAAALSSLFCALSTSTAAALSSLVDSLSSLLVLAICCLTRARCVVSSSADAST